MAFKHWKKTHEEKNGDDIFIIYRKGSISLELFKDSEWGKTDNMNVIIRDASKHSVVSNLGQTVLVKYFDTQDEAKSFAKKYMREN